ncbi:hypothetical protein CERSUDRAFT_84411 [Gelatoporia subvermispora B]|uniref:Uncharacterized protein n=1 Tax=Ceriporiopsis subvermispora (strain B) TaxID=914234 RepID=M2RC13_CERS8|nr:hypothetical protein CERSUDRAFT_84411 [Gelatoporia subvermispora B]
MSKHIADGLDDEYPRVTLLMYLECIVNLMQAAGMLLLWPPAVRLPLEVRAHGVIGRKSAIVCAQDVSSV